ncbi:MAG: thiamine pyrophosphate-dependent enzyme [Xanthomonadales bacterium]|jgi:2-oxoglutarate ferredoxin oxidoreductase subunit beta|nr:thiamine pyrophosphate-dependent enzyme [Xanthomonadales bacterium]
MSSIAISLLDLEADSRVCMEADDYQKRPGKWCAGCGDFGVLNAVKRLLAKEQLQPDKTAFISGIGCSSRFPHYVNTYGFHGIHGRALPVATGLKLARPELDVFVTMGDGDCTSIGAGHWIHATRYNANMVVLLLDNNIYGLTKNQTSPTTPQGYKSNTSPRGAVLPALDPLQATLGVTNASFVAQTADWVPVHLYATLQAAYDHPGFSFVRILQRCPKFTPDVFQKQVQDPDLTELLVHENGVDEPALKQLFKARRVHDPLNLDDARALARRTDKLRLGVFFRDDSFPVYEEVRAVPKISAEEKVARLNKEFERYAV